MENNLLDVLTDQEIEQLEEAASEKGFGSISDFLKDVAAKGLEAKKFERGVTTPSEENLPVCESSRGQGDVTPPEMVTFAVTFECTREFLDAFRAHAQRDNRTLKYQVKQLAEDYTGMPAVPVSV